MKQFSVNVSQFSVEKEFVFECKICAFNCIRRYDYNRHISTSKHKKRQNETILKQNAFFNEKSVNNEPNTFLCSCGNSFKSRTTLWRHKKCCDDKNINIEETQNMTNEIILDFFKQNQEFQKNIFEFIKNNSSNVNSNNTINNNCNNKTFNLQVFLNEKCKDALNIDEFIDSLKISITDLENLGETGFVNGVSQIFVNGLRNLDIYKRPIHCSDLKREILYLKQQNVWGKDNNNKDGFKKIVKMIAHKNMLKVKDWKEKYPEYKDGSTRRNDQYLKILMGAAVPYKKEDEEDSYCKIIKNVAKEVTIDKQL